MSEVEDLIRYDILTQDAMRGVLKKVLQEVARTGLPGEHHFYITFDTNFSGVRISNAMKEKYPEEMTIVVQHQFWDMETYDSGFSISLSFNNIPETLYIPYNSIQGFFDPSVQFGLQFDVTDEDENAGDASISPLASPSEKANDRHEDFEHQKKEIEPEANDDAKPSSADVVSLDSFRKK